MYSLRPQRALNSSRPTIQELANFLLSPPALRRRCLSQLTRRASPRSISPISPVIPLRKFSSTPTSHSAPKGPRNDDRGPVSSEDTQTNFSTLDVLGNIPVPSTSVDACLWDGFHLNSGLKIVDGDGILLVGGEAFTWRPWKAGSSEEVDSDGKSKKNLRLINKKGQWEVDNSAWGLLGLVWPKPDILVLGLGKDMYPVSPKTRQHLHSLGIRIDIQDTRNAAAQFNVLATERGVGTVAAAMIPFGWREGVGVK